MTATTIEVRTETWRQLNLRKEPGESFDDVIQALMNATTKQFEDPDAEPEYVRHYEIDEDQQCAHYTPDRGPCTDDADYIVVLENHNGENEIAFCEKHANISEEGDSA